MHSFSRIIISETAKHTVSSTVHILTFHSLVILPVTVTLHHQYQQTLRTDYCNYYEIIQVTTLLTLTYASSVK